MVSLTKSEKIKLKKILAKSKEIEAKTILNKINNEKRLEYAYNIKEITTLLKKAHKEKKKVKIKYYSLSSDEVRWRKIAIYQFDKAFIIAFCYLRNEERTFVTNRIYQAAKLNESYQIPKDWTPKSRVWSN